MADGVKRPVGIQDVVQNEEKIITKRRDRLFPSRNRRSCTQTNLIGLALSGGGIRSAVTNLGVLYEMSRVGLLNVVDYLSTVSGGGYIGCCLASLLSLKDPWGKTGTGAAGSDDKAPCTEDLYTYDNAATPPSLFSARWKNFPFRDLPLKKRVEPTKEEVRDKTLGSDYEEYGDDSPFLKQFTSNDQIFHLRNRASYLIPSSLPFGSHVIRAFGAVSASTLLSLLWFFSLIVMITSLYMVVAFSQWNMGPAAAPALCHGTTEIQGHIQGGLLHPKPAAHGLIQSVLKRGGATLRAIAGRLALQGEAFSCFPRNKWLICLTGLLWGLIAPACMHRRGRKKMRDDITYENLESYVARKQLKYISFLTIGLLCGVLVIGYVAYPLRPFQPDPRLLLPLLFSAGCLAGSLIMLCLLATDLLTRRPADDTGKNNKKVRTQMLNYLRWNRVSRSEVALCSGIFLYCLAGSCIFAFLPAFILAGNAGFIALVQAILVLVLRFYLQENKKKTGPAREGGIKVFLGKIGRWLMGMLVPLVVLLAVVGTAAFLGDIFFDNDWPKAVGSPDIFWIVIVLAVSGLLSCLLSILNFNNISPHVFYKDRLAEAFLTTLIPGKRFDLKKQEAARWVDLARNAVEMDLVDLHGNDLAEEEMTDCAARGPYLLINATLNLTAARDVKGFRRQSENFLFSRCYTGSERTGFLQTCNYTPPIELGRAMTISGAALTSVMGAKGSLAESFACTILGVRLGYWLRNPIDMAKKSVRRRWNWKNLYYELFRYTDTRDSHVYLSDGGHCGDNLGLLALLRRGTKLIIASDAECDPEHVFDSLTNSIRRAYVDHNIKIHISLDDLMPDENKHTRKHFAIGRILYPDRPWQKSWLLVIKNTITGKESLPILNYRKKSPSFPHETTADQFFTEEQFEVYRSLGREACMEIWKDNTEFFRSRDWRNNPWSCIDKFCDQMAGKEHKWNDVIRAIWSSERGDFSTWSGFSNSISGYVGDMEKEGFKDIDESPMVKQLHDLDRWLQKNSRQFDELDRECDIPRTWNQLKEIKKQIAAPSGKNNQEEEKGPFPDK